MRIALDLDGVLADLNAKVVEQTRYTQDDFTEFGEWEDYEDFMSEARRVWKKHWQEIEPIEDNIGRKTAQLTADHEVDVVTNTASPDKQVQAWLDKHDVVYEDFVRPPDDAYKDALDYDAFIDDNPYLCGDVPVQYVVDQQWNQTERGSGNYLYHSYEDSYVESKGRLKPDPFRSDAPWVIRVTGLDDVLYDLEYHVPISR